MTGRIQIVGMGPGSREMMTPQAATAIAEADVVVGYTVYVELIRKSFPEKDTFTTPMRKEMERCRKCYEFAMEGKHVAMVCSGDAGVYGMASPVLSLGEEFPEVDVEILPGITAANSGAAVLGAPLNHDYCVISLSDLLTPWAVIEKRIRCAIQGDFALAIYNPSSRKRADYLKRAVDIMMSEGAASDRACGYVMNIGRAGTQAVTCTLDQLREASVDMFTTVFVGNSQTIIRNGKMMTPRGYRGDGNE